MWSYTVVNDNYSKPNFLCAKEIKRQNQEVMQTAARVKHNWKLPLFQESTIVLQNWNYPSDYQENTFNVI